MKNNLKEKLSGSFEPINREIQDEIDFYDLLPQPREEIKVLSKVLTDAPVEQENHKLRWLYILIALVVLGVTGADWEQLKTNTQVRETERSVPARLPVRATKVTTEPMKNLVFGEGESKAVRTKTLTFARSGTITYVKTVDDRDLRPGDRVRKGELLARVDNSRLKADIARSEADTIEAQTKKLAAVASVKQAQAVLEEKKANTIAARADLQAAKNNLELAKSQFKRLEGLLKQGAISASNVDVYRNQIQNAVAKLKAAEAILSAALSQVKAGESKLAAAKAELSASEAAIAIARAQQTNSGANLEDTHIKAPFDGIIAHLNIRKGDYFSPQQVQPSGEDGSIVDSVPMRIIDPSEYEILVRLDPWDSTLVRIDQQVCVFLDKDMTAATERGMSERELFKLAKVKGRVFLVQFLSEQAPTSLSYRGRRLCIYEMCSRCTCSRLKRGTL